MSARRFIDNVALIHIRERKVLVALSAGKDAWYLPGGKREPGESDVDVLRRELLEELNADIASESVRYFGTYEGQAHGERPGTLVRMVCYSGELPGEVRPGREIAALDFFGFDAIDRTAPVVRHIFHDLRAKGLI